MVKSSLSNFELMSMGPSEFRALARRGEYTDMTVGVCRGYAQANLAIVPKQVAFEFLLFCNRNPRPCPVLDVTEPGNPHPTLVAPEADLRTDLPKYRIFREGQLIAEPTDITDYWRDDLVAFLLGCANGFDWSLRAANVQNRLIGAYTTNIQCIPAVHFRGPMVVSCRLAKGSHNAVRAVQISSRVLAQHGPPVHIGAPEIIGISDLYNPDQCNFGEIAPVQSDEIALFWGCGITPQSVALEAKVSLMITHCPAHMFVTDRLTEELANL